MSGTLLQGDSDARGIQLRIEELAPGLTAFRLHSRWTRLLGFESTFYLLGDLLIDTGFPHAGSLVLEALETRKIRAILCTHQHEDHTGNAGAIARRHHCPVYLRHPELRWSEGTAELAFYRRLYWGRLEEYSPLNMPESFDWEGGKLEIIPTPGHSISHVSVLDQASGTVFTGDLYVAGGASAVMVQENLCELAESLVRVADAAPRRLLSGHGLDLANPGPNLRMKAEAISRAAEKARNLMAEGLSLQAAAWRVFPRGHLKDLVFRLGTEGEFSRRNFVASALRCAPEISSRTSLG